MASTAGSPRVSPLALSILLMAAGGAPGQISLSLNEAESRKEPDFLPRYEGRLVRVRGRVAARPVQVIDYAHLALQDESGYGLTVEGAYSTLSPYARGDRIEVSGRIAHRAGLPVLVPAEIRRLSPGPAPAPVRVQVNELNSFRYLGMYVVTEGEIQSIGANIGGHYIMIGDVRKPIQVFLPYKCLRATARLTFSAGDRVRVAGLASQYCPLPPHNRMFQILIGDPGAVELTEGGWPVPAGFLTAVLLLLLAALAAWSLRERRSARQRRRIRSLYALGEEMTAARPPGENLRRLRSVLPELLNVSDVELYVAEQGSGRMRRVESENAPPPADSAGDTFRHRALESCFRNRSLLAIPDLYRSPYYQGEEGLLPRSALFVPMFVQNELLGILEISHAKRVRHFSEEEQALAQHLANQIGIGLKLYQQRDIQDQLFRSEKLAATGQLVSNVAGELRSPLAAVANLAETVLVSEAGSPAARELRAISAKARHALEIVNRLLNLARSEKEAATSVDASGILGGLLSLRKRRWAGQQIELEDHLPREPVMVVGSPTHLEHVLQNLLTMAERSVTGALESRIRVRATRLAGRVVLEIHSSGRASPEAGEETAEQAPASDTDTLSLGLCRSILRSHAGDLRLVNEAQGGWRCEVDLPAVREASAAGASPPALAVRSMTALVAEPDAKERHRLLSLLDGAGHRAVPAGSAEDAANLIGSFHFHVVFCSVHLPGLNWLEFFDWNRGKTELFVLLTEGYDDELLRAVREREGLILTKPLQPEELGPVLALVESRLQAAARRD